MDSGKGFVREEILHNKESLAVCEAFLNRDGGPSWGRTRDLMLIKHAL